MRGHDQVARRRRRRAAFSCTPIANSRSNTASGWSWPACFKSVEGGQTISSTVTPCGRVDGEDGGNQRRIARLVRLRVQPFGQRDLQRHAHRGACRGAVGFDERRDFRARPADLAHRRPLRVSASATLRRERKKFPQRPPASSAVNAFWYHFTSFSGMTPAASAARTARRSLHRRQILEHEIPLPPLRRIRRLQPVPRRQSASQTPACVSPSSAFTLPKRLAMSARTWAAVGYVERDAERDAEVDEDLPVFHRLAGRRDRARRPLQPSLLVRIGRFLLDVRCARQHEIGGARQLGQQHALDDEQRERAARAASRIQPMSPSDPSGPGSKTYSAETRRPRPPPRSGEISAASARRRRPSPARTRTCARR